MEGATSYRRQQVPGTAAAAAGAGDPWAEPAPTPAQLKSQLWSTMRRVDGGRTRVLGFYGHHRRQANGCFSNFAESAFAFELPRGLVPPACAAADFPSPITVEFSEKAIMLAKAAAFGDAASYRLIASARTPDAAKRLGRKVRPFDDARWQGLVCHIAREVVWQKFSKLPLLRDHLLGTGCQILAEATRNDRVWGIGLNCDEDIGVPARWRGTNVLGWALMQARERLRAADAAADAVGATAASEKAIRKLGKKLADIDRLKEQQAAGTALMPNQLDKIAKQAELRRQMIELSAKVGTQGVKTAGASGGTVASTGASTTASVCAGVVGAKEKRSHSPPTSGSSGSRGSQGRTRGRLQ